MNIPFLQCLLSVCTSLSYFCAGLVRGWSAPGLPSMQQSHPDLLPNKEIESWIGSIPPLGAFFGSLVAGPLLHYVGRKRTVMLTSPLWMLAWTLIATANGWEQLVIGRFLSGFSVGVTLPSAQIYVSECTDSRTRGVIGSFPSLAMSAGILLAYVLGAFFTWLHLAWTFFVVSGEAFESLVHNIVSNSYIIFAAFLFVVIAFLPESPVWLDGRNELALAKASREWLRLPGKTENGVGPSAGSIADPETSWRVLLTRPILMPMLIGLTLLLIQQVSGIDAVIFFTVNIFKSSGELCRLL